MVIKVLRKHIFKKIENMLIIAGIILFIIWLVFLQDLRIAPVFLFIDEITLVAIAFGFILSGTIKHYLHHRKKR